MGGFTARGIHLPYTGEIDRLLCSWLNANSSSAITDRANLVCCMSTLPVRAYQSRADPLGQEPYTGELAIFLRIRARPAHYL